MSYAFGKDISYSFYLRDENNEIVDLSNLTDSPNIKIYEDIPSRDTVDAQTGDITSWAALGDGGKSFTISAVSDPNPSSANDTDVFYLGIKTPLQNSGQAQIFIRALPMRRASITSDPLIVVRADLQKVYQGVDAITSDVQQDAKLSESTSFIKQEIHKEFDWASIWKPSELKNAVLYRALYLIMLNQIVDDGDQWTLRAKEYKTIYSSFLSSIKFRFDANQDGTPDGTKSKSSTITFMR